MFAPEQDRLEEKETASLCLFLLGMGLGLLVNARATLASGVEKPEKDDYLWIHVLDKQQWSGFFFKKVEKVWNSPYVNFRGHSRETHSNTEIWFLRLAAEQSAPESGRNISKRALRANV